MEFIEMPGKTLLRIFQPDELDPDELRKSGLNDDSLVRINRQGDIELRTADGWEIIGGLLGEFDQRIRRETGLDWA
jgi:hypothetical protein